jgi:hypothetical protein
LANVVSRLQDGNDIEQWWLVNVEANHSRQDLMWPDDREKALGMKLLVLRELASERLDLSKFGFHVFDRVGGSTQEDTAAIVILNTSSWG